MLDFYQLNEMLMLFKRLCKGLYLKQTGLVHDYILYYREMLDKQIVLSLPLLVAELERDVMNDITHTLL